MTSAFIEYSADTQLKLRHFFRQLGLPLPDLQDVRYTTDKGRLLLLTDFGCTIRLMREKRSISKQHPHFIKPLFSCMANYVKMDIYPGLQTPAPGLDSMAFRDYLKTHHQISIYGHDAHSSNFGYIPGTQFPVMLDVDRRFVAANFDEATIELTKSLQALKELLPNNDVGIDIDPDNDPHNIIYGDIIAQFDTAWSIDNDTPDCDTPDCKEIARAWAMCRQAKQDGLLMAPWEAFDDTRDLAQKAKRYQDKMAGMPLDSLSQ